MSVPLGELGTITDGATAAVSSLFAGVLTRMAIQRVATWWDDDAVVGERQILGLPSMPVAIAFGSNQWWKGTDPPTAASSRRPVFGIEDGYTAAIPPFDVAGIDAFIRRSGYAVDVYPPERKVPKRLAERIIYVGGKRVNKRLQQPLDAARVSTPFRFVDREQTRRRFRRKLPERIVRYFADNDGQVWSRHSKTNRVLVDSTDPARPPFGPYVSSDGEIESDVVLLTVVPRRRSAGIAIIVQAGYGAAVDLPLLFGVPLYKKVMADSRSNATPWFQAVFVVPVDHSTTGERYRRPELLGFARLHIG